MTKAGEWIKRYLPAEILSFIATLLSALVVYYFTRNKLLTALAATWGGNIGYFGYILAADVIATIKRLSAEDRRYKASIFLKNMRALMVEFGFAELLDSFLIRPLLMYYLPILFHSLTIGVVVAKFAADITFYVPAILGYELSKKRFRNF